MKHKTITMLLITASALLALADAASAYYSPGLGRFLNRDPINEPGAVLVRQAARPAMSFIPRDPIAAEQNTYCFVNNSPIISVDPHGLWGSETHWGDPAQKRVKGTYDIAKDDVGFSDRCARVLADWNQGVDDVTPAWLFPQFHFEPGRTAAFNNRWNKGVSKLKKATVWYSWIEPCVYDGLAHIGEALHSYQDSFAHTAAHDADTPWKHVSGPNSGSYLADTRFYKKGDSLAHRPDDPDLWPADHAATVAGTRAKLEEIWKIPSVQCHCKQK